MAEQITLRFDTRPRALWQLTRTGARCVDPRTCRVRVEREGWPTDEHLVLCDGETIHYSVIPGLPLVFAPNFKSARIAEMPPYEVVE